MKGGKYSHSCHFTNKAFSMYRKVEQVELSESDLEPSYSAA